MLNKSFSAAIQRGSAHAAADQRCPQGGERALARRPGQDHYHYRRPGQEKTFLKYDWKRSKNGRTAGPGQEIVLCSALFEILENTGLDIFEQI